MAVSLPRLRVGEPLRHESMAVFPLFADHESDVEYRLADEALAAHTALVEEVSEAGSVPNLVVENKGDVRLLFLEGEELVGAKQNRILNTSVLVAAHSRIRIPVSCVEHGRWRYKSRYFSSGGSHSPSSLRRALKASVSQSVHRERGHTSDQGAVWNEVATLNASLGVDSSTSAMADAFGAYEGKIAEFHDRTQYVDGASGMAVAVGGKVVSIDLFDKPETCRKVWKRLLSGLVFDALNSKPPEREATAGDVEQLLAAAGDLPWSPAPVVGEGEEYRAESKAGDHATTLAFGGTVVHGSVVAAV